MKHNTSKNVGGTAWVRIWLPRVIRDLADLDPFCLHHEDMLNDVIVVQWF